MACAVCRKCVAGRQDARRRIDSQSTAHVKSILSEVANRLHSGIAQTLFGDNSLVCRLCFRTAEKLAKLKEEVTAKEAELERSMKISVEEAVASLSPQPRGSSLPETPTRAGSKRSRSTETEDTPQTPSKSPSKRTPTRITRTPRRISRLLTPTASESPCVAVS